MPIECKLNYNNVRDNSWQLDSLSITIEGSLPSMYFPIISFYVVEKLVHILFKCEARCVVFT